MQYLRHVPRSPLDGYVEYFWQCIDGQSDRKERILPTGTVELVINLCQDEVRIHSPRQPQRYKSFAGAAISGTYTGVFVVDGMQHACMMGVHFRPAGAFPFLDVPAHEVRDTHADLAEFWGRSADELRERLCEAADPHVRFHVMEETLIRRLDRFERLRRPVPVALDLFGKWGTGASVRDAAREIGFSQRHLIHLFTTEVGLTPKVFCRVLRFQRARNLAEQMKTPDWAELALVCGYFDQSHLINDFQEFSSSSPADYLREHQQVDRLLGNHAPLPQAGQFLPRR